MTEQFTPPPWEIDDSLSDCESVVIISADGSEIADVLSSEADAHLFKAAPKLYWELKDLVERCQLAGMTDLEEPEEVLREARGEGVRI
jgi:hypothetical protein